MLQRLRRWRHRAQDSLFYRPTLGFVIAVFAAWGVTSLDNRIGDSLQDVPFLLRTTIAGARSLLTTAAAATITVAGIVLSVTVVAVQLAASQFSPRVVATVFGSRFQQTVIAIVTGTFTFDLLVLGTIHGEGLAIELIPSRTISVTVALILSIVSVMAIIAFIDRSIEVMKVGEIIRRSADDTLAAIRASRPEEPPGDTDEELEMPTGPAKAIRSAADGWVQNVDVDGLFDALPKGAVARMDSTTGSFVGVGTTLMTTWSSDGVDEEDVDAARIQRAYSIGDERLSRTDPTFGIRQLVDIALRALSPGINDPTTATEVILRLTEILREVLVRDLPPRVLHGADGRRVFRPHEWSRRDWVRHAFGEIRNASTTQPAVAHALISSMGSLLDHLSAVDLEGRGDALRTEAELVLAGLESGDQILDEDVEPIRRLAQAFGLVGADS